MEILKAHVTQVPLQASLPMKFTMAIVLQSDIKHARDLF